VSRPLRLILDTTAVLAYARGGEDVGEVLVEVADEEAAFGAPAVCLAVASAEGADPHRLDLLASLSGCVVLPGSVSWRALSLALRTLGRLDLATVLVAAVEHGDPHVLTGEPRAYEPAGDAVSVIGI
jgi:hypothetical protein